jgi:hypothetical protein
MGPLIIGPGGQAEPGVVSAVVYIRVYPRVTYRTWLISTASLLL